MSQDSMPSVYCTYVENICDIAPIYVYISRISEASNYLKKALDISFAHREWIENGIHLHLLRKSSRFQDNHGGY